MAAKRATKGGAQRERRPDTPAVPGADREFAAGRALVLTVSLVFATLIALLQPPHVDPLRMMGNWDLVRPGWWLHPLERNAFLRGAGGRDLYAVIALSSDALWAAGKGGLILHSADGGASWAVQRAAPLSVEQTVGGLVLMSPAWAAQPPSKGESYFPNAAQIPNGAVVPPAQSPDQRFLPNQQQTPNQAAPDLRNLKDLNPPIELLDVPDKGGAPNAAPELNKQAPSDTAIQSAVEKTPPPPRETPAHIALLHASADLRDILFIDAQHGWAAGDHGTLLITLDGGRHWHAATTLDTVDALRSPTFLADGQRGWVASRNGSVLATTDGGMSWSTLRESMDSNTSVNEQQFAADGLRSWQATDGGVVTIVDDKSPPESAAGGDGSAWFNSVCMLADGQRGWAAGWGGKVLITRNGGRDWQLRNAFGLASPFIDNGPLYNGAHLQKIRAHRDGQRVWAVGTTGTIVTSADGGMTWMQRGSGTQATLNALAFLDDGVRGWVVGQDATLLASIDSGASWHTAAAYRRYPPPWYFLLVVLAIVAGPVLVRRPLPPPPTQAMAAAASALPGDMPIRALAEDRLGFTVAVRTLARFIFARETQPRITLAVTGDWGSGKSSLMRMLQSELDDAGYRTAWFNAWHHQQEGRPLSALFNVIRRQAVPGLHVHPLAGLRVRSRLVWERGWGYRAIALLIPLTAMFAAGDFLRNPELDNFLRPNEARERLAWWASDWLLQAHRTVVTEHTLSALHCPADSASVSSKDSTAANVTAAPATDASSSSVAASKPLVRTEICTFLRNRVLWDEGEGRRCDEDPPRTNSNMSCVFTRPEQLLATIASNVAIDTRPVSLRPSEMAALTKYAESLPPPLLFPGLQYFLLPLAAGLGLLFTKGISVYGLELLRPVRNFVQLLGGVNAVPESKEEAGTIERYRAEFGLLTEALDGRLVIFIDDLDRCQPAMVNGVLETTNYLTDVGRCFIVLGMAMDRVMSCIVEPHIESGEQAPEEYARQYLRKLVHIEMPVPVADSARMIALYAESDQTAASNTASSLTQDRSWSMRVSSWLRARPALHSTLVFARRWLLPAALLCGTLAVAYLGGGDLNRMRSPAPLMLQTKGAATTQRDIATTETPAPGAQTSNAIGERVQQRQSSPDVALAAKTSSLPALLALLAGGVLLFGIVRYQNSEAFRKRVIVAVGGAVRTHDSDEFAAARALWHPIICLSDATPRGVKRFANRARLFAIYDAQAAHLDNDENLAKRSADLVALCALHHFDPRVLSLVSALTVHTPNVEDQLHTILTDALAPAADEQVCATAQLFIDTLAQHSKRFGGPIEDDVRQEFLSLAARIHIR